MSTRNVIIVAMAMIFLSAIVVRAQESPVYFADTNLKAAVEETLGITNPTPTDMFGL